MAEVDGTDRALINFEAIDTASKIKEVLIRTARLLPPSAGSELLALTEPAALATMTAVTGTWAGAHLLGAGEIADVVLLIVGYLALGGVAVEAGQLLYRAMLKTMRARSLDDYDAAAHNLAKAISLLGVQAVLAVLAKRKPRGTFRHLHWSVPSLKVSLKYQLPRNGRRFYKPKLTFVGNKLPGWGATITWTGDMRVSKLGSHEERLLAIYHERVHSFLVPKLYPLRNLRCHIATAGYVRSYLLRYLEEALAETVSLVRVKGLTRENLVSGLQFPIRQGITYNLTIAALEEELRGIAYGSITVGGMVYQLYRGTYFNDE